MEFFGLDIGSHKIKIVQVQKSGDKYRLVALGSAPSTLKGILSDSESDLTQLATIIKKLHQETKIKTKNVVTALPQDQVFTQVITLPQLSENELTSALKWEAEQYIPIPLAEATISHQIIGRIKEDAKEKIEVLLAAAPNRLIDKTIKVVKSAGFNTVSLETEILAVARSLVINPEAVMVIDFGAKASDIAVVENKQIIFTRSIPTAGEALTRAVASSLGLQPAQAEAYKKAYGVDPQKLEGKMIEAMIPVIDVIIREIEKILNFYRVEKKKTISRIILTGGTATLSEISSLMVKKLNLEIQLGNPFSQMSKESLPKKLPTSEIPLYAIATGLAMKEIK